MRSLLCAALALAAAVAAPVPAPAQETSLTRAHEMMRNGEFEAAAAEYEALQVEQPENPLLPYGYAAARYRAGEARVDGTGDAKGAFEDAERAFETLANQEFDNEAVRQAALFAHANSVAQVAKQTVNPENYDAGVAALRRAVQMYEDYLGRYPADTRAQQNLRHVRYLLKNELRNPPDQPEQDQDDQQDDQVVGWRSLRTQLPGKKAVSDERSFTIRLEDAGTGKGSATGKEGAKP